MKSKEVFNKIESIINDNVNKSGNSNNADRIENEDNDGKNEFKEILYLLMQLLINILKAPFKIVAKYLRDEIIIAAKNDAKIYMVIVVIMGILFVFFSLIWLFVSFAVAVYFYYEGNTILTSIVYSVGFQLIAFVLVSLVGIIVSKKLKSLKVLNKLKT